MVERHEHGRGKRRDTGPASSSLALVLLFLMALSVPVHAEDGFTPAWRTGDRWVVGAVYRSHPDGDGWSAPVYWEYAITGCEGQGPDGRCVLEIRDRGGSLKLKTRLVCRVADCAVAGIEITKTRRGEEMVRTIAPGGAAPTVTEQTLTPYDIPVFPLVVPSSRDFERTRGIDGLQEVETIRQDVARGTAEDVDPPVEITGGDLIGVRCTGRDGLLFVQYWDTGLPWPVYGENRNMKYWLVSE